MDANARTGERVERCDDGKVLGAHGHDGLNNNGERLLILSQHRQARCHEHVF